MTTQSNQKPEFNGQCAFDLITVKKGVGGKKIVI